MSLPDWSTLKHNLERDAGALLIITLLVSATGWIFFCFQKYAALGYTRMDLAIYTQVFYNTSYGHWFAMSIHPQSYLGDHFEPLIAPLSLLFALWRDARMLIGMQVIAVHLAAIPLFLLARSVFKKSLHITNPQLLALLVAVSYILNPLTQNALNFEFHLLPFFLLPFFIALWAAAEGRLIIFLTFCLITALVREDVALLVASTGFIVPYLFRDTTMNHRHWWRWGAVLIGLGTLVLAMAVISRYSPTGEYKYFGFYGTLHGNVYTTIEGLAKQSLVFAGRLIRPATLIVIFALFATTGLVTLGAPQGLLLAIIPLLEFSLTEASPQQIISLHYGTLFLPALMVATTFGLRAIIAAENNKMGRILQRLGIAQPSKQVVVGGLLLLGSMMSLIYLGPRSYFAGARTTTPHQALMIRAQQEALMAIPPSAAVVGPMEVLPTLALREYLYPLYYVMLGHQQLSTKPYPIPVPIEYVLLSQNTLTSNIRWWLDGTVHETSLKESSPHLQALTKQNNLSPVWAADGIALLSAHASPLDTIDLVTRQPVINPLPKTTVLNDVQARMIVETQSPLPLLTIHWSVTRPQTRILFMKIEALDDTGQATTTWFGDPGWGLWPTTSWLPNEEVTTHFPLSLPVGTTKVRLSLLPETLSVTPPAPQRKNK